MSQIHVARLDPPVPDFFRAMTYPVYRHLLSLEPAPRHPEQGQTRKIQPLALAAFDGGTPVGLLLADMPLESSYTEAQAPEVLSVFVTPAARRRCVATALFLALEGHLAAFGHPAIQAIYTTGRPGSEAIETILERCGWAAPTTRTVLVQLSPREFVASELFAPHRMQALDPGFEIFPWAELPAAEREALRESDERSPWVTPGLAAWKFDTDPFDREASVGARYRGTVVGWVIAQPINATAVRYLASFLRKDLSHRGRILPLYQASLTRAAAAGRELATFVTPVIYPTMIRFIHRWMAPHAQLVAETRGSTRALSAAGEGGGAARLAAVGEEL